MGKPNLLRTILKDMPKGKLQSFLLSKESEHFNTIIMTPVSRCYYDVVSVLTTLLKKEALSSSISIYPIDQWGNIIFPKDGQIIEYYMKGKNVDFLTLLKREGLLEKISFLAIGPKSLVSDFRKEFMPMSMGKGSLSSFLTQWVVKPTVISKYLASLYYFKSRGVFSKGPLLTPKQIRKNKPGVKVSYKS